MLKVIGTLYADPSPASKLAEKENRGHVETMQYLFLLARTGFRPQRHYPGTWEHKSGMVVDLLTFYV